MNNSNLKIVENYEWLTTRINDYRTDKSYSNFFFLAQKIQHLIRDGRLSTMESNKNLFIFEKASDFYRMYYFLRDLEDLPEIRVDMPVVIEFPYREKYSEAQTLQADYIQKLGFKIARKTRVMSVKAKDILLPEIEIDEHTVIRTAAIEEQDEIQTMLNLSFDRYFSFLPDEEELHTLLENGKMLSIYYDGILAGIIETEIQGRTNWLWHFNVRSDYRKKGLGKRLFAYVHRQNQELVKEFMFWVDVDNTPAVNLYKKFGYTFAAKGADEYIYF